MNKDFILVVEGEPTGKGRPRFTKKGVAYTPEKTREYERKVKLAVQKQNTENIYFIEAVNCEIVANFPIPKNTPKKKKELMLSNDLLPLKKPDCDNIAKIILDSLNGVLYDDDKQITSIIVYKKYSENPNVTIAFSGKKEQRKTC